MKLHMRTKILILCLSSTLLALTLQTFLFQRASANLIYGQAKTENFGTLQNMQNEIYTFVKNIESNLIEIYNNKEFLQELKMNANTDSDISLGELQDENYRLAYTLATDKFNTGDGVVALYIYNAKHEIISTYRRAVTPKHNYPKDIYENEALYNGEKIKEYIASNDTDMLISSYYNEHRETNIVHFVLKIYDNTNIKDKIGYVVCDVDSSVLLKIMEKYRTQQEMYMWLQPLGDRKLLESGTLEDANLTYYQQIDEGIQSGTLEEMKEHTEGNRVLFQVPQKKYNLDAYSIMPQSLLRQNQKTLTQNLILIAILMIVIITAVTIYITRALARPLEQLTDTIAKIRSGHTNQRVAYMLDDEIGQLGKDFNEMLDEIERLISHEYETKLLLNKAEYKALQAQINPHFLYNTLDTMSSIASIQNCPTVSNLCQSLSNIFRYSLDIKHPYSTVAREIVHLKNYIFVMNVRMREDVAYDFDIDEEVLQDSIPRISIQPLVENAINHGLRNKKGEKRIQVQAIKSRYESNAIGHDENTIGQDDNSEKMILKITVSDNGVGMDAEEMNRRLQENDKDQVESGSSIGLFNINARMKMLYGAAYGLHVESSEEGTRVTLQIPRMKVDEVDTWQK